MNNNAKKPYFLRFPIREQIVYNKRLAMLLRAGTPMREALMMLDTKSNSRSSTYILKKIIEDVSSGKPLSVSMMQFSSIFGIFSINMVRVGESSGALHANLAYLAEELKKKDALKKKVMGALVYPAVIVVATIGISTILTVYIFPKIIPIFQGFKHQLPLSTRTLIALSSFLLHDGLILFLLLVVAGIGSIFLLRFIRVRRVVDRSILYLPLFGTLTRYYNLANITRTTSLLLKGDVRIVAAIEIVAESSSNIAYRESLQSVALSLTRGKRLSHQIDDQAKLYPPLSVQMISAAEDAGDLSGSLMYISDMYEEEITDLTRNLTTLLEPVLMLVMGAIVGFIAVSIITPIYGITQDLTLH